MSIKLYMDHISQPARAVWSLCEFGKIPYELIEIRVNKKMNKTEEYRKINPFGLIPAIDDGGFILYESHAIMAYLADKFKLETFYPSDLKERAQIDCYLHWHHSNTRNCVKLLQIANKNHVHYEVTHDKEKIEYLVKKALSGINDHFLGDNEYLCNQKCMTIADISAACEIIGLDMIDFSIDSYPKLQKWHQNMMSFPEMIKTHETYFKLVDIIKSRKNPRFESSKSCIPKENK